MKNGLFLKKVTVKVTALKQPTLWAVVDGVILLVILLLYPAKSPL